MQKTKFTDPKQVIIARRDIKMPSGKLAAQVAHASVKVLLDQGGWTDVYSTQPPPANPELDTVGRFFIDVKSPAMFHWMTQSFPKIVLGVDSQEELETLYSEAQLANLPCALVIDSGRTVYDGIATLTCIAIGPAERDTIDKITGHLKLYKLETPE